MNNHEILLALTLPYVIAAPFCGTIGGITGYLVGRPYTGIAAGIFIGGTLNVILTLPFMVGLLNRQPAEPTSGENKQILERAMYNGDAPKEYECPISMEVMSDPVFDPSFPQHNYDRNFLEYALFFRKINPMTQMPLSVEQLQANAALKQEINNFVLQAVRSST